LAGSNDAELVITDEYVEPTIGDFFQFEMIGNFFPDSIGKAIDEEKYLRVEDYDGNGMRMEVIGKGETVFEGETVDYFAMTLTWDTSFTLYLDDWMGDGDGKEDIIEISTVSASEIWQINEGLFSLNGTDIKTIDKMEMTMIFTINEYEDQSVLVADSIEETETEVLSTSNNQPNEVRVGDVWTASSTERTTGTTRDRMCEENDDDCEWEIEDIDEEETVTTTSEALREVSVTTPAGTFETLEVKDTDEGEDPGNYSLMYVSETGIPTKLLTYEVGVMDTNMQLESYRISDLGVCENCPSVEEDADGLLGELPALPFLISLAAIALIAHRTRR
jgi:hypothetical protein